MNALKKPDFIGLIIKWGDVNPLSDTPKIIEEKVSHTNPIKAFSAPIIWSKYKTKILTTVLEWRITVEVVFDDGESEEAIFTDRYNHSLDNEPMCQEIEKFIVCSRLENPTGYVMTRYSATVIGE